jgi:hypothetical protein
MASGSTIPKLISPISISAMASPVSKAPVNARPLRRHFGPNKGGWL